MIKAASKFHMLAQLLFSSHSYEVCKQTVHPPFRSTDSCPNVLLLLLSLVSIRAMSPFDGSVLVAVVVVVVGGGV